MAEWGKSALNRRIHGKVEGDGEPLNAVLYRDKLARTFDSQGYVNFRNLAKISSPKKKERTSGDGKKCVVRVSGNELALVEVVEDENEKGDSEDLSRLLGEDVRRLNWRGSTRLLLLDDQCANRTFDELPEAVKVVFEEYNGQSVKSEYQLVRCRLSLFYDYWQISEILEALLPSGMQVPLAFELVGHIAHLNLRDDLLQYKNLIAKVVLDKTRTKIQTVVNKVDAIHNDYKTMHLEVLAGNNSLVTTVVENGLCFNVDLAAVFQDLSNIFELCRRLTETNKAQNYHLIDRLIRLVLTLSVTYATTKCAFSAMVLRKQGTRLSRHKTIKSVLRKRMESQYLSNSMVVYIERELSSNINSDSFID